MATTATCACCIEKEEVVLKHRTAYIYHGQVDEAMQPHGQGTLHYFDGVYRGEFEHGQMTGKGYRRYLNTSSYAGCFSMGAREGRGRLIEANGGMYEGLFQHDLKHGNNGIATQPDGQRQEGLFLQNKL